MKPTISDDKIIIAVVGEFQIGKSSLINCLLGRKEAKIGNGWKSETPLCADYEMADDIVIVDTPGVDDRSDRDEEAMSAIKRAHCVLVIKDNKDIPAELYDGWVRKARDEGKPCVFVLNCVEGDRDRKRHWDPKSEFNAKFCNDIHGEFIGRNGFDMFMSIGGDAVLPVNACWAQYGLGILDDDDKSEDVETMLVKLGVDDKDFKQDAFERSNVKGLCDFIGNIRLELLTHYLRRKEQIIRRFTDRFCEEFAKRMQGEDVK